MTEVQMSVVKDAEVVGELSPLTILCDTPEILEALKQFILNYRETIQQYMNGVIGNSGKPVDSDITVDEHGEIKAVQLATNKGFVLVEDTAEGAVAPLKMVPYLSIQEGTKYLTTVRNELSLFIKDRDGYPDMKVGRFPTLQDAANQWNSDTVKEAVKSIEQHQKAKEKEVKRLTKLGKSEQRIEDAKSKTAPVKENDKLTQN